MKTREQIDEKYKWDIEFFNDAQIENVFKIFEKLTKELPKYKGQLGDKEKLFEYWFKFKKEFIEIDKLSFYLGNAQNVDNSNTKILKLITRFTNASQKLGEATSFAVPQLYELDDEYLNSLLKDERFKDANNFIKNIIKFKPHKLDEKSTDLLAKINKSLNQNADIFEIINNSELTFEDALDGKGKPHKVDNASFGELVSSTDRTLRTNAYNSMIKGFANFNKTFACLLLGDMESDYALAKLRKYNSVLEEGLLGDDVPQAVFDKNIEEVNKNLKIMHEYLKICAKKSGLKDFSTIDLYEDKKIGGKMTVEKAQEILLKVVEPLGADYVKNVKRKLADKSIDYMPNKNKRTGGYSSDCYGAKSVILMNWTFDYDALSTLCHEMGHCINSEYYVAAQPREKAGIIIPLAEIASTVNEILLTNYMLKTCKPKDKAYYLSQFLETVRGTIFSQTLYTEFELFAHNAVEKEIPITYEDLNNKYLELMKKYYGVIKVPENAKYAWSRVPHFYTPFYVYAYSTGMITAIAIVSKLLADKNYYKKYIEFLKNGVDRNYMEILKHIDIDLTTNEPYEIAFKFIKERLKEFKNL